MALTQEEIEKRIQDSYELPNNVIEAVPEPMVTVRTSTYQHGPYIKDCIEGVLMQKTSFPVEYIIGEDFSTDGTREFVFEYARKYPDKIRVLTADYNVGAKANGQRCIRVSRGKYVALCEGDDYWTDPYKLQKQVDFLEANPDHGLVHSNYSRVKHATGETLLKYRWPKYFNENLLRGDIVENLLKQESSIWTGTVCFRSLFQKQDGYKRILNENFKSGDFIVWSYIAAQSKIGYLPELTAVRRLIPFSATQGQTYETYMQFFESDYRVADFIVKEFSLSKSILSAAKCNCLRRYLLSSFSRRDSEIFFSKFKEYEYLNTKKDLDMYLRYWAMRFKVLFYPVKAIFKFRRIFKSEKVV